MHCMEGPALTVLQVSLSDFRLSEAALEAAASAAFKQLLRYKSMATRQPPRAGGWGSGLSPGLPSCDRPLRCLEQDWAKALDTLVTGPQGRTRHNASLLASSVGALKATPSGCRPLGTSHQQSRRHHPIEVSTINVTPTEVALADATSTVASF